MNILQEIIGIVCNILQIAPNSRVFDLETPLIGAIPEFDSMAVVNLITALEDRFGFAIEDDEIDASVFETVGSLVAFVESKL